MLYSLAICLIVFLGMPLWLLHSKTRPGFFERFGFYRGKTFAEGSPRIWLHGASAGDLLSLSPMVTLLRERFPNSAIIVSCITDSGQQMAQTRLKGIDAITFVPWDLPLATRRAVKAIQPDLLVLEYTEIWPNLIRSAKRSGAKIALTNGRFSPKHLKSYRRLFALANHPLRHIDLFLMREEEEAERALALGAPKERVIVTGNTKFDALVPLVEDEAANAALRAAFDFPDAAPIFIAGSTHEGEEPLLIDVFQKLLQRHPDLRLVIAPRYLERASKVAACAEAAGFATRLRSAAIDPSSKRETRVAVLDTIGELTRAYCLATVVFVGGSFTSRGGQNILEPAAQGRPVLFGPNMDNFKDSVRLLVGRGGIQVKDPERLFSVIDELLSQDKADELKALGELAFRTVSSIRGASKRNVEQMAWVLTGEGSFGDAPTLTPMCGRDKPGQAQPSQETCAP
jgi:3-deoxy-D-manno-octulosonic-acid transferase